MSSFNGGRKVDYFANYSLINFRDTPVHYVYLISNWRASSMVRATQHPFTRMRLMIHYDSLSSLLLLDNDPQKLIQTQRANTDSWISVKIQF